VDALEAILTRRSIRAFAPGEVPLGTLKEVIKAAMHAPSAADEQPWYFVIITDRALLEQIPSIHPYAAMTAEAAAAILVCGSPGMEKHLGMWVQDCAAATQNLLLAIHAKGLGSVWLGVYPREERMDPIRKLFGLPEHILPFAILPVGVPAEVPELQNERYREERIRLNHW